MHAYVAVTVDDHLTEDIIEDLLQLDGGEQVQEEEEGDEDEDIHKCLPKCGKWFEAKFVPKRNIA